jgi:glycerol-3-phosphate O-acyltransferase/dihydroxyacetone phosphate acyltransferase
MANLVLEMLDWFLQAVIDIFFREVSVRGSFNFPSSGPTIVVVAPHANQYLDAAISIIAAHTVSHRQVFMIEAASSYYSKWMGIWSRWSGAIPVERPQDLLVSKNGIIKFENYPDDQLTIIGEGTNFLKDCEIKGLLGIPNSGGNVKIAEIISDNKLKLTSKMKKQAGIEALIKGTNYKVAPRINNNDLFDKVFDALHSGKCIGIAPEGGSHDRPELIEFKPGVALMALGTVAKYSDTTVTIVPCGLNYFHPHKFRSRAVVEYGNPIIIDQERAAEYKIDSRKAVNKLMSEIGDAMNVVTTQAPDYQTLQVIQAARRLYSYGRFKRPPLPVVVEMNRNLLIGYNKFKDDSRIVHLKNSVLEYNRKLRTFGLKDHQLETATDNKIKTLFLLINRIAQLLFYSVLSLPGTILFSPIFIVCSVISKKKQKLALAKSVVKINATDVLASWKVLIALFFAPVCYFIYSTLGTYIVYRYKLLPSFTNSIFGTLIVFCSCWAILVGTTYSAFKMGEVGMDIYKSIKPLVLSLSSSSQQLADLKEERKKLSIEVTEVVNELGPKVFKKFNENHIHKVQEEVELEQEEIRARSRSRSRSVSRSRSASAVRESSLPSLSRSSSNYSGFSAFDGENDAGKLPDLNHVSIFPDQLQMPDTAVGSSASSVENIPAALNSASSGVNANSLSDKIRQAVIQRNKENEQESEE